MKRTTIFIPESIERDLHLYARRERRPAASIVREAIAAYIARGHGGSPLPSFAGAFDSGRTDTAERHEELLFGALTPHGGHPTRPKRARRRTIRPARRD